MKLPERLRTSLAGAVAWGLQKTRAAIRPRARARLTGTLNSRVLFLSVPGTGSYMFPVNEATALDCEGPDNLMLNLGGHIFKMQSIHERDEILNAISRALNPGLGRKVAKVLVFLVVLWLGSLMLAGALSGPGSDVDLLASPGAPAALGYPYAAAPTGLAPPDFLVGQPPQVEAPPQLTAAPDDLLGQYGLDDPLKQ